MNNESLANPANVTPNCLIHTYEIHHVKKVEGANVLKASFMKFILTHFCTN